MSADEFKRLREYLEKINDPTQDKCWFCGKTPDSLRAEFFEYMKNPAQGYEDFNVDDVIFMSYKTQKPICASCYFLIKRNPDLVQEILKRPEGEIWDNPPQE
tara:strand:- start:451 stop:756 length:306 start_codon:yes stop_codon:yes gene_type:complete